MKAPHVYNPEPPPHMTTVRRGDWHAARNDAGLNPGEIVAVPSELPDPENWEVLMGDSWTEFWASAPSVVAHTRRICRPINKEAGE